MTNQQKIAKTNAKLLGGVKGGENNSENIEIFRNKEAQNGHWPTKRNAKLLREKGRENSWENI